jgi:hypothetical protein
LAARRFFCFRNVQNSRNFGNSKHSKRLSDGCQKKNRLRSRGVHPHPSSPALYRIRACLFFGSKLEDVDVNILLAGRLSSSTGHTVGVILLGRCAGLEVFRLVVGRRLSNRVANGQRRFRIQVNVTAEQAQLLKMRAAVEGVSVSRVVVDSLFKPVESGEIDAAALRESVVLLREYRRKLEGATTNLNQIAKHANTVSQVPANFGDVVRRLEEVTDEVNDLLLKVRVN